MMEFKGYRRDNGRIGTRNYVGIISTVVCANEVAEKISSQVLGTVPFLMEVASGKLTKAEINGYTKAMDIYVVGPVI